MHRVMGRVPVHRAWTVKKRTELLGKEDREIRGFEVVKEKVMCALLGPDSAWTTDIVLLCVDQFQRL